MRNDVFAIASILILSLTAFPVAAIAAPPRHHGVMVLGEGTLSCGRWMADRKTYDMWLADMAWVEGFLTGYNDFVPGAGNITAGTDVAGMEAFIDGYCANHPLNSLANSAEALIAAFLRRGAR